MEKQLILKVKTRDEIIFEGPVKSLTSFNDKGRFDILDRHASFISLIYKSLIIRPLSGKVIVLDDIKDGLLRIVENKIDVYLNVKEALGDLNV